jgi:hypothetical protein
MKVKLNIKRSSVRNKRRLIFGVVISIFLIVTFSSDNKMAVTFLFVYLTSMVALAFGIDHLMKIGQKGS